ncbi:hypothetical protein J6590_106552 [Homalodisca vitripennis]|nr:hypothetical protein J6590_106552 [Homalodisca vitripennis]
MREKPRVTASYLQWGRFDYSTDRWPNDPPGRYGQSAYARSQIPFSSGSGSSRRMLGWRCECADRHAQSQSAYAQSQIPFSSGSGSSRRMEVRVRRQTCAEVRSMYGAPCILPFTTQARLLLPPLPSPFTNVFFF